MRYSGDASGAEFSKRLVDGDESVLGEIIRVYGSSVASSLTKRYHGTLCHEDIADALELALVCLWRRRKYFDPADGSLPGWFGLMANDAAATLARSRWVKARRLECDMSAGDLRTIVVKRSTDGADDSGETSAIDSSLLKAVAEAPALLPAIQRQILLVDATAPDGRIQARQLAIELHVEPATIRTNRKRGLRRMRELLAERGFPAQGSKPKTRKPTQTERERETDSVHSCAETGLADI